MSRTPDRSRRGAFSLVELLVVIAVVGALLAITVPALRGARRASGETASLANLSQIALTVEQFAAARNGEYPQMKPYAVYQTNVGAVPGAGVRTALPFETFQYWPGVVASGPEFDAAVWGWVSPTRDLASELQESSVFRTSYHYSHTFVASPRLWTREAQAEAPAHPERFVSPVRQSTVAFPSGKAMFFDWDLAYWGAAKKRARLAYGLYDVPTPVLFADGHAAAHKPSEARTPFRCPIAVQFADAPWMNTPGGALGADH